MLKWCTEQWKIGELSHLTMAYFCQILKIKAQTTRPMERMAGMLMIFFVMQEPFVMRSVICGLVIWLLPNGGTTFG